MWYQKSIEIPARKRGFHLITREILEALPELPECRVGMLNVFIQHTSASLSINENADPTVRDDFESYFSRAVPEGENYYKHTLEGPDDLPAHIKASVLGVSLNIPVSDGRLALGVWQGIYLCEHRDSAGGRTLVLTLGGE
ncbi:secondary thiamine-phosphate synthase enzyme [Alcanivorax sp. DSM 26293]|uniref:secondary thiamine-phosphate synthase enzyme YjbQ n=1 Tax=Alcanivorax sp. DSM 26293 TaxID=1798238 RepID=UPI00089FD920|nr:secondary thiamine-phosphate synthase enzyme YjbQ [Alcanivorax sp. DSM 26293]SEG06282.1 secondary thiamine-phosphate synthase enzyme [Alcanivorax sp. DSM 26293]